MNFQTLFYNGWKYAFVNFLTLSRILICPVIIWLLFANCPLETAYCLLAAFLTDALDGFLARKLKVTSEFGTKLDSIADDCLFITAMISVIYIHPKIILENFIPIIVLVVVYMMKMFFLWHRHKKMVSGLHTYLTKFSAFMQAIFFLSALFFEPSDVLFKIAFFVTILAIIEEMIIILNFDTLSRNIKGFYFHKNINE